MRAAAARRYAKALFALAGEEDRVAEVGDEIRQLAELFDQSDELRETLLTPLRRATDRKSVLDALTSAAGLSPVVRHFFSFLIDQRRLIQHSAVVEEYDRLAAEASGRTTAWVTSAAPLADAQRQRIVQVLSSRTGRDVTLEESVDPDLIGGAVVKLGDLVFDGSLRKQLAQLHSTLTKGPSA